MPVRSDFCTWLKRQLLARKATAESGGPPSFATGQDMNDRMPPLSFDKMTAAPSRERHSQFPEVPSFALYGEPALNICYRP